MGGPGTQAKNVIDLNPEGNKLLTDRSQLSSDPQMADLLANYGTGGMSLNDALNSAKGLIGQKSAANQAQHQQLETQRQNELGQVDAAIKQFQQANPTTTPGYQNLLQQLNDKKTDVNNKYNDQLNKLGSENGNGLMDQFQNLITTNPLAAQRYGTDELKNNSLTSGLFGDNGMQHQAENDATNQLGQQNQLEKEINSGDWQKINEKDNTIYGQMSGDLARQTGQQEQQLSQALADRGLSAAPSGAAVQGISGIYGNKMEQLAQMQQGLVQQKYNNALNAFNTRNSMIQGALNSDRQTATNLGALGQTAMSNLYNRNMGARNAGESEIANATGMQLKNQVANQGQLNTGFEQVQESQGPSFGDIVGGIFGVGAGAAAKGAGTKLGDKIF